MAPEVPGLQNNTPTFSENVPGVQFPFGQQFGKVGEAAERIGEDVEGLATKGNQIYDEVQRQHDISTASSAYVDASIAHAQQVQNLKQISPDGLMHDPTTNEVIKNADGSQQTIAQAYWQWADQDYQARQNQMTPRAASMFRQEAQDKIIGHNTLGLQAESLTMQQQASQQSTQTNMAKLARGNDTSPWGSSNPASNSPYYQDRQADGTILLRGNTDKINDQLQTIALQTAQRGPVKDASGNIRPGLYNGTQVQAQLAANLSNHSEAWLNSAFTDILQNNGPRDKSNAVSTTALQQFNDLRDVVEGKDPKSVAAQAKNLPTVNSSLTSEQIDKWRTKIDAFKPEATEIDTHEYSMYKTMAAEAVKGAHNWNDMISNPLIQHVVSGGAALGISPEERVKDLAPIIANAMTSSGINSVSGPESPDVKRAMLAKTAQDFATKGPQFLQTLGMKDTNGFGQALIAEGMRQATAKLNEEINKQDKDPVAYLQQVRQGPQSPDGVPRYISPMANAVHQRLDPNNYPSTQAIFQPMSNGKTVLQNAFASSGNPVLSLSEGDFKEQKARLLDKGGQPIPQKLASYFYSIDQAVQKNQITKVQAEAFQQDLIHKGGMPEPYIEALKLHTDAEKQAQWNNLATNDAVVKQYVESPTAVNKGETDATIKRLAAAHSEQLFKYLDIKYGPNDNQLSNTKAAYMGSWSGDYVRFRTQGMSQGEASEAADKQRSATSGEYGVVGATHKFLGLFGSSPQGPQVPVEYGNPSPNMTEGVKQNIRSNLLSAQTPEALSRYKIILPPGVTENPNAPRTAQWVSDHAALWLRIPGGYQLNVNEMADPDHPNGYRQPVYIQDPKTGKRRTYDVMDGQALSTPPSGERAISPIPRPGAGP